MFLSWRHILHHAPCPFLIFYCSSPASLMIAPVSLRAGVQLRATLYVYVGISDLSILKTSLSQYHKHFCFGLILQLFFCVCQLTTYFAPCTKSLLGFLLFAPPPPRLQWSHLSLFLLESSSGPTYTILRFLRHGWPITIYILCFGLISMMMFSVEKKLCLCYE